MVLLEDLAAHFNLRTQDAINRVHVLQEVGRLTGNICPWSCTECCEIILVIYLPEDVGFRCG